MPKFRRWVAAFVVAFTLTLIPSTVACQTKWGQLSQKISPSVVFLYSKEAVCTGFVIDQPNNVVLTAAHCGANGLLVEGKDSLVIAGSPELDLLVLEVPGLNKPSVKFSPTNPEIGEEIASLSYGHGLNIQLLRVFHVSTEKIGFAGFQGLYIATDSPLMKGQSGGPLFNTEGKVVGMANGTAEDMGIARGSEQILDWLRSIN